MTISLLNPCSSYKTTRLWVYFSLVAAFGLLAPAMVRADVTASVDKGQATTQHKATGAGAPQGPPGSGGGYGGKGSKGGGSMTDTTTGSVFYTITVRNMAAAPVSGVTVEYHFFNKSTSSGSGTPTSISVNDITASSTIDLDANGKKDIETSDIPKNSKHSSTPGSQDKKSGKVIPPTQTNETTSVMGWVVYLKKGDKVVHTYTSTDTILDEVAKINRGGSGGGGASNF